MHNPHLPNFVIYTGENLNHHLSNIVALTYQTLFHTPIKYQ